MSKRIIPKQFLGAFKKGHRQSAREFIDEELAYKLLEKAESGDKDATRALEWLTKFNNEYHKDAFDKNSIPLHTTKKLKKECQDRSNHARADMFSRLNKQKKKGEEF